MDFGDQDFWWARERSLRAVLHTPPITEVYRKTAVSLLLQIKKRTSTLLAPKQQTAKARRSSCSGSGSIALIAAQQAERSFCSKQRLSVFWVPTIHVQPPGRRIVSFPGKNCNPASIFYFIYLKSLHFNLCPVCDGRSQLQSQMFCRGGLCALPEKSTTMASGLICYWSYKRWGVIP